MYSLVQKILGSCERVANNFLHPGANYTYMYNLHTVCKSAHVNGALAMKLLIHRLYFFRLTYNQKRKIMYTCISTSSCSLYLGRFSP